MLRRWFPQQVVGVLGVMVCVALRGGAVGQAQTSTEPSLIPRNATALEGVPAVRLDATKETATRRTLDGAEARAQGLRIRIVNGQYFWASRENRPLTLSASGDFTYLSSTEPGQYVRFRRINDRIAYVEHVDSAFGSVTYWGELRIVLGQ
jgi:pectin methylesterase-like acyl-CoA thioesterase